MYDLFKKLAHMSHLPALQRLQNFPLKTELNGNDVAIAHVQ